MAATVCERVRIIIAEQADAQLEAVMVTSGLDGLGLDSLDVVEIGIRIEDEFHVEIPTKEIQKFQKVSDVVLFLDGVLKDTEQVKEEL